MKTIQIITALIVLGSAFSSCGKEDFDPSEADNIASLGGDIWAPGEIDNWIAANYTVPYNIDIKYKWNQFEVDLDKTLVPPKEEYVIPVMDAIKKVWIDIYVQEKNLAFFNQYSPKFFVLAGSPAYEDGAIKLGTAEGGRKITLYNINNTRVKGMPGYTLADSAAVLQMFHVIHHEFAHILHQNILYPLDFKNINPSLYTTEWINYTDAEARSDGFLTAYSMNVVDDDFVEMVSIMLVEGRAIYEKMIADIPDGISPRGVTREQAVSRLRTKESIVVNYYKQTWGIDFYELQSRTRAAIEALIY